MINPKNGQVPQRSRCVRNRFPFKNIHKRPCNYWLLHRTPVGEATLPSCLTTNSDPFIWTLSIDGSSNMHGSGLGIILTSLKRIEIEHTIHLNFNFYNNKEEYEAPIIDLYREISLTVEHIWVYIDSQLIINRILGDYVTKEANLMKFLDMVCNLQR